RVKHARHLVDRPLAVGREPDRVRRVVELVIEIVEDQPHLPVVAAPPHAVVGDHNPEIAHGGHPRIQSVTLFANRTQPSAYALYASRSARMRAPSGNCSSQKRARTSSAWPWPRYDSSTLVRHLRRMFVPPRWWPYASQVALSRSRERSRPTSTSPSSI